MDQSFHILILEDSADDFELIKLELQKADFECTLSHVTDKESFEGQLAASLPDVILSDYNIPGYDIMQALDALKQAEFNGPVILVTGALVDEEAINLIVNHDVNDYIFKNNLAKLNSAIVSEYEKEQLQQELQVKNRELEKLSLVASHTHNGVIITDAKGRVEWVNNAFIELTGYEMEEMKGKKPGNFLQGPDTDPNTVRRISKNIKQAVPFTEDILNYTKDGSFYWIKLNITPILNEAGEVEQFIGIQEEITDKKELENILKDTLNQVFIIDAESLKFVYCNQKALDSIQYSEEELREMTPLDIKLEMDKKEYQKYLNKARKNGSFSFQTTHTRKDGSRYNIFCEIRPDIFKGKPVYVTDVLDITDIVKAREQLTQVQKFNQLAVDGAGVGLWEVDLNTYDTFYNSMYFTMLGYDPSRATESFGFYESIIHPEDALVIEDIYDQIKQNQVDGYEEKVRLKAQSGDYRWIYSKAKVVEYDSEGKPLKLAGSNIDITNLEKVIREKDVLIQEVHHRVKNNLAIISGLIELQLMRDGEDRKSQLENAKNRIHAIAEVHNQLYNTENFSEIKMDTYFESLIAKTKDSFMGNEQDISVAFSSDMTDININQAVPLGLLINELITNSLKHAFPNGQGTISIALASNGDDKVRFKYEDSGDGFKPTMKKGLGLELINTLVHQLTHDFELVTENEYSLEFEFEARHRGAHSNM